MAQAESLSNAIRALIPGARPPSPPSPVWAAHAAFVSSVAGRPPFPIPVFPQASDLEDRADHLKGVLDALSVYLKAALADAAQNVPGGLELGHIDALLCDLTSEVTGTLRQAADTLPGGCA
jgi:hypothetical protein